LVLDRDRNEDLELTITDVLHTPKASANLIAMGALALKGVEGRILKDRILIERGSENLVGIADMVDAQYVMRVKPRQNQIGYANPVKQPVWTDLQTWHRRLGHLGLSNVRRLARMSDGLDIGEGDDSKELPSCDACQQGKLTAMYPREPMRRASEPFELVHSDIGGGGKLAPGVARGHRYWITFLDDYTGMVWLYTMKARSDAITCFRLFNQHVRNLGASLQRLRTDNAREYGQGHFKEYLDEQGTQWEPTAPYSAFQNGKAERVNRTLQERTIAILQDSGLPANMWPELMQTVVYLVNRSPKAGFDRTPFEFFYGYKPDLSHLRVIGCRGWVLIPKETRTSGLYGSKLHRKAMRCQLVGYGGRNQYRVYREDGRVVTSANVVFDEKTVGAEKQRILADEPEHVSDNDDGDEWESIRGEPLHPPPSEDHSAVEGESDEEESETDDSDTIEVRPPPRPEEGMRRSKRVNRGQKPARYLAVSEVEPQTLKEALQSAQADEWRAAMKAEVDTLLQNDTWTLKTLPEGRQALSGKWVFKVKRDQQGRISKYKARWVVRGFEQRDGLDLEETFATVVKATTFKVLFALVAIHDWELHQMDVKGAFLYGEIGEEVYVKQPEGFDLGDGVCHLRKALYGLRQSPRVWYHALKRSLESVGFRRLESDHSVFLWKEGQVIVAAYVDDLLIAGPNLEAIKTVKKELQRTYEMNDLGECSTFLNIRVTRDRVRRTIKLDQESFTTALLKRFDLDQCKAVSTPMDAGLSLVASAEKATQKEMVDYQKMVGSLMYLMCETRPDIAFVVSTLSRYLGNPSRTHFAAVKRVFRYLQGTKELGTQYGLSSETLLGYSDSDWAGSKDDRKSTSGHIFLFGGGPISWSSKRQSVVATSTTEAEYIAAAHATKEAVWLQMLLRELGEIGSDIDHVKIRMDNTGAIALTKNPEFHQRTKHMDVRWHYIREQVETGKIQIEYTQTSQMVADGLTKPLKAAKFQAFVERAGLTR
jgi:transposase InsO family protein